MLLQINQELSHWVYSGINEIFFFRHKIDKKKKIIMLIGTKNILYKHYNIYSKII